MITILFCGYNITKDEMNKNVKSTDFENISNLLSTHEFEQIKKFILEKGDRRTYRNIDNNNPHYSFNNFDVFLASDVGQRNINNDPEISDFNQVTIADWESDIIYYQLIIVRKGDLKKRKAWLREGMKEEQIYLVDIYGKGINIMKDKLLYYLRKIKEEINRH